MPTSLLDLPDELVIGILDRLDMSDVVRHVSTVCQRLNQLAKTENLWKGYCAQYWLNKDKEHDAESWKENFLQWHKKWGKYMGCYARVKSLWTSIETSLRKRKLPIRSSLKGPVDEMVVEAINEMSDTAMPAEVACSYLIHNGQQVTPGTGSLMGNLEVYDHHSMEVNVPLDFNIKNGLPRQGFLILSWCPYVNYGQALCLRDLPGRKAGCIFYLHDVGVHRSKKPHGYFILAASYMEWLQGLADRLSDPTLIVEKSKILRFYHEPSCVAVTRDVKVTVATAFVPRLSQVWREKTRTLFAYRISMTMDENMPANRTCKLVSRHWEITDSTGQFHEVNGEAVIGLYPVMKPGSRFSYCSWTPFDSEGGFMEGHFTFVNITSGEQYDVICPRFNMKCPEISYFTAEEVANMANDVDIDAEDEDDDYY